MQIFHTFPEIFYLPNCTIPQILAMPTLHISLTLSQRGKRKNRPFGRFFLEPSAVSRQAFSCRAAGRTPDRR